MDLRRLLCLGFSIPFPRDSVVDTTGEDINLFLRIKILKGHEDYNRSSKKSWKNRIVYWQETPVVRKATKVKSHSTQCSDSYVDLHRKVISMAREELASGELFLCTVPGGVWQVGMEPHRDLSAKKKGE